ncbi:hypothetical protein [Clostridium beijerinckii]|nr:hypothetical protein [Clostridium beijerinckii]MBA8937303.1 hypothetical protein [Clostridium beijerinckii]NRU40231.1 hypothetical protein [Clostridium beijerinckii]NSA96492.1 hypothetical protein [Clostridium beijerinckii]OOM63030.1 hypothetical protein CLOBI_20860 [Clostridium beijerinckii]OOM64570.1 hypothetical protein CLBEIC_54910 [Clostridium beijerinckii]
MNKKKKEINLIWMITKEEFDKRFTLAVQEYFKNYTAEETQN